MKKLIPTFLAVSLLTFAPIALAHGDNSGRGSNDDRFELKIRNDDDDDDIRINAVQKFEIEGNKFEISGEIESISGNSFKVGGQTILIDASLVSSFEQKGILKTGAFVKVEGQIINGNNVAREIKVVGTGQGRFKFEVRGVNVSASPSPTPSPSPTVSPNPTPSASPSPSATPTATLSENVNVEIKANGPIDQVVAFLKQALSFLENLLS